MDRHPSTAAEASPPTATSQVSFHTIAKGYRSGIVEPAQVTARTQAEWIALWQKHSAAETTPSLPPTIDFSKNIVVGVFLGQKPTGGYDIEITGVERSDSALTISFREQSPRPGAILTQAFTQPFHIVSISVEGTTAVHFRRTP